MIWGKTHKELSLIAKQKQEKGWFAWYPIMIETGRWCWLERVRREYWTSWGCDGYDYFLIKNGNKA